MVHPLKTRPDPNAADPLSEPTVGRRLWAAYLARGYNRKTFAEAVGHKYMSQDNWDMGRVQPSLDKLKRAAELVGFSLDQLAYGHTPPTAQRVEPELTREGIKALLFELRASGDQIEALGEYERSAAGQYQRFTRSYVAAFTERYALSIREGRDRATAIAEAKTTAANARANAEAIALRLTTPQSVEQLAALGAQLAGAMDAEKTTTARRPAPRKKRRAQ